MKGLFQRTGAPIQTAMLVEMIRLLQQCQQVVDLPEVGEAPDAPGKTAEILRLESMGFTNAAPVAGYKRQMGQYEASRKIWETRNKAKTDVQVLRLNRIMAVRTLIDARQTFGEDTLLIPYGDFERLIRRYDLVCGPFSSYHGDIPADKADEIESLQDLIKKAGHGYINELAPLTGLRYSSSEYAWFSIPGYIKRFPFAKNTVTFYRWWPDWMVDMRGNKIKDGWKYEYEVGIPVELFICAPSRHMDKIRPLRVPRLVSHGDPFICAHTDYGILVFTRWGEEADDEIVRKYESANRWLDRAKAFISSQHIQMSQD